MNFSPKRRKVLNTRFHGAAQTFLAAIGKMGKILRSLLMKCIPDDDLFLVEICFPRSESIFVKIAEMDILARFKLTLAAANASLRQGMVVPANKKHS